MGGGAGLAGVTHLEKCASCGQKGWGLKPYERTGKGFVGLETTLHVFECVMPIPPATPCTGGAYYTWYC